MTATIQITTFEEKRLEPLTETQRSRVESSIEIAERAARRIARKKPAHEHQIVSAASEGLMRASESYDRLAIHMPWEDWASVHVNRAITNYLKSRFGRRFRREVTMSESSKDDETLDALLDPKGENDTQMIDIDDLLLKIPTYKHGMLAQSVVFGQVSEREAGDEAGFGHGNGPRAWAKVASNLITWGSIDQ
jgi:hypothetical protein